MPYSYGIVPVAGSHASRVRKRAACAARSRYSSWPVTVYKYDSALIASEVEAYLAAPTGQINLITLGVTIPFRDVFQAGMAYLRRTDPARFEALAVRAHAAKHPKEDREFLASLVKA